MVARSRCSCSVFYDRYSSIARLRATSYLAALVCHGAYLNCVARLNLPLPMISPGIGWSTLAEIAAARVGGHFQQLCYGAAASRVARRERRTVSGCVSDRPLQLILLELAVANRLREHVPLIGSEDRRFPEMIFAVAEQYQTVGQPRNFNAVAIAIGRCVRRRHRPDHHCRARTLPLAQQEGTCSR